MSAQPLRRLFQLAAVLLLLSGCAAPALPTRPAEPAPTHTPLPTANPTAPVPTPDPSPAPSPTHPPVRSPSPAPAAAAAGYVVVISLDGCRPDYLELGELPNLRALIAAGTSYSDAWIGQLDSSTAPGHTTMSTGSFPNHHGILSFNWLSPAATLSDPTSDEAVNRGEMARVVANSGVPTLAALVKARYPDGIVAAVSATKAYAAMALGMGPTDIILYGQNDNGTLTPTAVDGYAAPSAVLNDAGLRVEVSAPGEENLFAARAGAALVAAVRPRALLLNLSATDLYGHSSGGKIAPKRMTAVMQATDRAVGELVAAYRAAGIYEQTLWVITADHGMIPNSHLIDPQVLQDAAAESGAAGSGKAPYAYLTNPDLAQKLAETIAKKHIPGIVAVYYKLELRDGSAYLPAPTIQDGLNIWSDAAYRYLLSTVNGPTSPAVVIPTAEDAMFGVGEENSSGSHGWITWGDEHIPLILSGPGVQSGAASNAPARLVDLLPSIARLLGLPAAGWDGIVLADALLAPSEADRAAQKQLNEILAPLRNQLKAIAGYEIN